MRNPWCHVCCSRHGGDQRCPGELETTSPETRCYRVNVNAGERVEAFGVLLAPTDEFWRARIFTFPDALWVVPGGHASIKFFGETADAAEQQAIQFIQQHCRDRGFRVRGQEAELEGEAPASAGKENRRTPRTACFHSVRFGVSTPVEAGETGDMSEHGLYVITEVPLDTGSKVTVSIELADRDLHVTGTVRWARKRHHQGRAPGMGIQVDTVTPEYLRYVRSLG